MLEAEVYNERTVLDYLNEDCWRAVLQYVPLKELIRTECASRRWQGMVLTYLQGLHINIAEEDGKNKKAHYLTCRLKSSEYASFLIWTNKLGTSVASVFCKSLEDLANLKDTCPNLRALQLSSVKWSPSTTCPHNVLDYFKSLEQVSFHNCPILDTCVNLFLSDKALKKLEFHNCRRITGTCFESLNLSNLESLALEECIKSEDPKHLLSAVERLGELRELKLVYNGVYRSTIDDKLHIVLNKMPKLESLILQGGYMHETLPAQLSQLTRLRHLSVSYQMEDRHVETVTRCCQALRSLELLACQYLTAVDMIGRHAGARLRSLTLDQFSDAHDDLVVQLVRGCPALQSLTIGGAEQLTCALPARAAAERHAVAPGSTLRLDLSYTNLSDEFNLQDTGTERHEQYEEMKTKYEDLIVVLENTIDEYDDEDQSDDDDFEDNDFDYDDYGSDDYGFDFDFDNSSLDDYEEDDEDEPED